MPSPADPLAQELVALAAAAGLNLVGFVGAQEFDVCQAQGRRLAEQRPDCGVVVLLGSGGRGFWDTLCAVEGRPEPRPGFHPIDAFGRRAAQDLQDRLAAAGHSSGVVLPDDPGAPNFMQLAEMAGFGTVSPVLGILLHPEFGPWLSLRAAVLIDGQPFAAAGCEQHQPFQPCLQCPQPCVSACPAQVFDGAGGVDLRACASWRHEGRCDSGCDARRACPVGSDHRYSLAEEGFRHAYSQYRMVRHFGLGLWKFVPRPLR